MAQACEKHFSYEEIEVIANYLKEKTKYQPTVGIVCGSGLGDLVNAIENPETIPYDKIPHFPASTVQGHAGNLVFGILNGKQVVSMQGRFHYYEGYSMQQVTLPIRVMSLLGVKTVIVTNAAGGVNLSFKVGDVMILRDHINFLSLIGASPLRGPNEKRFGERFPALNNAYTKDLQKLAQDIGQELNFGSFLREGIYACVGGPTFETTAEVDYLRKIGADAVGMSTAHEVNVAAHCGMQCLGISLITNVSNEVNHGEVLNVGKERCKDITKLLKCFVQKLN